jgi:hypothetical protein
VDHRVNAIIDLSGALGEVFCFFSDAEAQCIYPM